MIFHPSQKKGSIYYSTNYLQPTTVLTEEKSIQYLGIIIDSNLEWKQHVNYSKIRYFVNQSTLVSLYYAFIYPYFTYSLLAWGHTYDTILRPIILLQKRALRIITFSSYCDHIAVLFLSL